MSQQISLLTAFKRKTVYLPHMVSCEFKRLYYLFKGYYHINFMHN